MWLTSSSIGRKLVMAVTGACLVLFVTFHALMNGVAIFWPAAYNAICAFLGANWYALIASVGLAALFIIHIIYAVWLTLQNRKARGADRYAVTSRPKEVEWASKNMLVLGIVVLAFLIVHLIQFWAKMQLAEICHTPVEYNGDPVAPQAGTMFLHMAFSQIWTPIVYIIGFVALWFHMNHGFWSMFQSAGWDNDTWLPRLKCIGAWWTSIVVALFIAQAIVFTVQAHNDTYINCPVLQEQYEEFNAELGGCAAATCDTPCEAQKACGHHHGQACGADKCGGESCTPANCGDCGACEAPCAEAQCAGSPNAAVVVEETTMVETTQE